MKLKSKVMLMLALTGMMVVGGDSDGTRNSTNDV